MNRKKQRTQAGQYEDLLLEAAFTELLVEECESLEKEPITREEEDILREAELHKQEKLDQIIGNVRRYRRKQYFNHSAKAVLQYAAAAVLIVNISVGSALAINPAFRSSVVSFLTNVTDEYVRIGFETTASSTVEVPDGWDRNYYPTYIPAEYELFDITTYKHSSLVTYRSYEGFFVFSVSTISNDTQMNSQNAFCKQISIHGCDALLLSLPQNTIVTWAEGAAYFSVTASDENTALLVAKSVTLIP